MLRLLLVILHFVGPQSPKNVLEMIHLEVFQLMMAAKKMLMMNSRNGFILVWESDLLYAFGGSPILHC